MLGLQASMSPIILSGSLAPPGLARLPGCLRLLPRSLYIGLTWLRLAAGLQQRASLDALTRTLKKNKKRKPFLGLLPAADTV